jgi:hypothetical protein
VLGVKQVKYVKQFAGQEPILGRICGIEAAQFLSRHFGATLASRLYARSGKPGALLHAMWQVEETLANQHPELLFP